MVQKNLNHYDLARNIGHFLQAILEVKKSQEDLEGRGKLTVTSNPRNKNTWPYFRKERWELYYTWLGKAETGVAGVGRSSKKASPRR